MAASLAGRSLELGHAVAPVIFRRYSSNMVAKEVARCLCRTALDAAYSSRYSISGWLWNRYDNASTPFHRMPVGAVATVELGWKLSFPSNGIAMRVYPISSSCYRAAVYEAGKISLMFSQLPKQLR